MVCNPQKLDHKHNRAPLHNEIEGYTHKLIRTQDGTIIHLGVEAPMPLNHVIDVACV